MEEKDPRVQSAICEGRWCKASSEHLRVVSKHVDTGYQGQERGTESHPVPVSPVCHPSACLCRALLPPGVPEVGKFSNLAAYIQLAK